MTHSPRYAPPPQPVSQLPAPQSPRRVGQQREPRSQPPLAWILSSIALLALALAPEDLGHRFSIALSPQLPQQESIQQGFFNRAAAPTATCQSMLNANQRLSRHQLTQFLSVPQETVQATIHATIAPPYCTLSTAHQPIQNEAYPLAFDPDTWFVVNYDQGIYQGYDFVFRK